MKMARSSSLHLLLLNFLFLVAACRNTGTPEHVGNAADMMAEPRFRVLDGTLTGLGLVNDLRESVEMNYFRYQYLYHSGGVAIGDLDQDGLPEVLLTTNRNGCRLYRNLGDLRFEDITETAGIRTGQAWCTGPAMADLNADGLLDIHVCVGGPSEDPEALRDLVFMNNGNGTFTERGRELGLGLPTRSLQAYHEDLDHDGDLDVLVVATRNDFENNGKVAKYKIPAESLSSHRLLLNDGTGHFEDATMKGGWLHHAWGLSAAVGDLDLDGLTDVYVAHDFLEPDLVMLNQGDGRFIDNGNVMLRHSTMFSMGSDLADVNNDGLLDLCVLDMTPPEHARSKQNMASMLPDQFFRMVELGWNHQYMANMLQLNNGDGTFSDIAHLAGVDRTDWSWAALFLDLDNDGWKDLFVSNGIWRDITNNDVKSQLHQMVEEQGPALPFDQVMELIPTARPENYMFKNNGDLTFATAMDAWGYHHASVSTGAAYGDLDRDGDLDLIVCDVGSTAKVVENLSTDRSGNWLQIVLQGTGKNQLAIGSRVTVHASGTSQIQELHLQRGFQGSVEPLLHFGLGTRMPDSLRVEWYDGSCTMVSGLNPNDRITLRHKDATRSSCPPRVALPPMLRDQAIARGIKHKHQESRFDDFAAEILLPHRQSEHGPGFCVGDLDGNGTDDLFLGGAAGQADRLFLQTTEGLFEPAPGGPWEARKDQEVIGAHFFDADGDGDLDLYTACGSTEFGRIGPAYQDHLYLNTGEGRFIASPDALPEMPHPTQAITSADIDQDGDMDLFVAGRNVPGAYPAPPRSWLLENKGDGRFVDATPLLASNLQRPGMVTDATFHDIDQDGDEDLLLCGEWMPVRLFMNEGGRFFDASDRLDTSLVGWWRSLEVADLDGDGDPDLVTGNIGLNNKFHPSKAKPLEIYMDDLDGNGTNDIVLAKHGSAGACYPVRGRECSSQQMPFIQQRFTTYRAFAEADLNTLYGEEQLAIALHYSATQFAHVVWMNEGGRFVPRELPMLSQFSPLNGIVAYDFDGDGNLDLASAGNLWGAEVETTRYDAGNGSLLLGDGKGHFRPLAPWASGLGANLNASGAALIHIGDVPGFLVVNVDGPVQLFMPTRQ